MRLVPGMVFSVTTLILGCVGHEVSRDEVARSAAPSARIEAVLVETNAGATTSFGYDVFLVHPGQSPRRDGQVASLYGAVRNERAYGVNLRWAGTLPEAGCCTTCEDAAEFQVLALGPSY